MRSLRLSRSGVTLSRCGGEWFEVWRDEQIANERMAGERCSGNAASNRLVSDGTEQLVFVSGPGVDEQHG